MFGARCARFRKRWVGGGSQPALTSQLGPARPTPAQKKSAFATAAGPFDHTDVELYTEQILK